MHPAEDGSSNNESGAAMMGMVKYAANHDPLPEDMPQETRELAEHMRRLIDSVRPNGEEPGCFPPGMLFGRHLGTGMYLSGGRGSGQRSNGIWY